MKIPIVKYSDKFLNSISWFMNVGGITLFPYIILREKLRDNVYYKDIAIRVINHESIHIKQQKELLIIPFYLWYFTEYFLRICKFWVHGKLASTYVAYKNISFEREAYANQDNLDYLKTRKFWAFIKYL